MSHVDIYFFPDPKAGNAAGQMASMVNYLVWRRWMRSVRFRPGKMFSERV